MTENEDSNRQDIVIPALSWYRDRPALPAGHPVTWGAITRGGVLEGVPFAWRDLVHSRPLK